jgi:DNA-directed RNA polymerase specialized sigma24 family protein
MTDEQLLAQFSQGDAAAYEALYAKYRQPLLDFVSRRYPDSDAEDVVQATFLYVYTQPGELNRGSSFRPWLFYIAACKALSAMEAQAIERRKLRAKMLESAA